LAPAISTNGFVADTWTSLQVTNATGSTNLVAPPGAVSVTCQVYEFNWSYTAGTVYFDDLYLTRISLPAPTAITLSASAGSGLINLSFPTTSGVTYEVLSADSLNSPSLWRTNSTVAGDGTVKGISYPTTGTKQFYRVLEHY
jgi:hypothetical protein